jgi:hypothetical protein
MSLCHTAFGRVAPARGEGLVLHGRWTATLDSVRDPERGTNQALPPKVRYKRRLNSRRKRVPLHVYYQRPE